MNKKMRIMIAALTAAATILCGCGGASAGEPAAEKTGESTEAKTEEQTGEAAEVSEPGEEPYVGMANPWVEITEEDAKKLCVRLFKAPEGAKVEAWLKCDDLGDPANGINPLIQLSFQYDDMEFTARAQQGASEDTDISGIYADWAVGPEDSTLANWGGGNMKGKAYRSVDESGYIDLIEWYDVEIGIKYSLSVSAEDLDGFDIQGVAEQMYSKDNEPYTGSD